MTGGKGGRVCQGEERGARGDEGWEERRRDAERWNSSSMSCGGKTPLLKRSAASPDTRPHLPMPLTCDRAPGRLSQGSEDLHSCTNPCMASVAAVFGVSPKPQPQMPSGEMVNQTGVHPGWGHCP